MRCGLCQGLTVIRRQKTMSCDSTLKAMHL